MQISVQPAAGLDAERAMLSSRLSAVSRRSAGSHKAPGSPGKLDGDREPCKYENRNITKGGFYRT